MVSHALASDRVVDACHPFAHANASSPTLGSGHVYIPDILQGPGAPFRASVFVLQPSQDDSLFSPLCALSFSL